jgi:hypothetical protein
MIMFGRVICEKILVGGIITFSRKGKFDLKTGNIYVLL